MGTAFPNVPLMSETQVTKNWAHHIISYLKEIIWPMSTKLTFCLEVLVHNLYIFIFKWPERILKCIINRLTMCVASEWHHRRELIITYKWKVTPLNSFLYLNDISMRLRFWLYSIGFIRGKTTDCWLELTSYSPRFTGANSMPFLLSNKWLHHRPS